MAGIPAFRSEDARAAYVRLYESVLAGSPVPVEEADVETSFGRTHVLTAGDSTKPPLVALHGAAISSTSWVPHLPTLTATHRVTMLDAIDDTGRSVATRATRNSADIVAWLDETLRAVDIDRTAIIGASRGAWMATHYAIAFPERVQRLALLCPVGVFQGLRPGWIARAVMTMNIRPTGRRVEAFLDTMVMSSHRELLRRPPWQSITAQFICGAVVFKFPLVRPSPQPLGKGHDHGRVADEQTPVLVVIGRDESLHNGVQYARRVREQLPHARVEVLDDANHLLMVDQFEKVEKLIAEFLQ